jgi:hypothetical protein
MVDGAESKRYRDSLAIRGDLANGRFFDRYGRIAPSAKTQQPSFRAIGRVKTGSAR